MSPYVKPLFLLFLGGLMVAISAPLRDSHVLLSSILFYLGYAIDAVAIVLAVKIGLNRRR